MEKKRINVKFVDQWAGWKPENSGMYHMLAARYDVHLVDRPDYVLCGGLGYEHLQYDYAVKILRMGENLTPDFNLYDYAFGFDWMTFGDRYLRYPLYVGYDGYGHVCEPGTPPDDEMLLDRRFCSFVVSNPGGDPLRTEFFERLSKYKKVDSGGGYLNNVGGPVSDKRSFCAQYKFNIAFENSCHPGYVTEKIMEPLSVWSVPIYYGAPDVEKDFSPECFVHVRSAKDVERAVEEIVALDRDDAAYLRKCKAARLPGPVVYTQQCLDDFIYPIFDRDLESVRRRPQYGMRIVYQGRLVQLDKIRRVLRTLFHAYQRLRTMLGRG